MPDSATSWTVVHQAPLSIGFPRQEYWSGLLFPSRGELPDPGIEPVSPTLQADSLPLSNQGSPFLTIDGIYILQRNLYAGQEATVKMGHGKRDWFQIGRIRQGCRVPEKHLLLLY